MQERLAATIDTQEHIDAIYNAGEVLRFEASVFFDDNAVDSQFEDDEDAETYARLTTASTNLEAAAEAFVDLQTERDAIAEAAIDLIETIDLHTDCMDNRIDREALDPWIAKLQATMPHLEPVPTPDEKDSVQIGLMLSARWIPSLNKATELARHRLANATDAEILEYIFFAGIVATIESVEKQLRARAAA